MSESPLFLSPYVSADRRAEPPLPRASTPPESGFDPDDESPAAVRPVREGLPAHYRMRAEPHYVEALARPREDRTVTPTGVAAAVPTVATDRALAAATESLAGALASINASLEDLRTEGRPLRERLLIELARAEALRAGWLADALAVLHHEPLPALDAVNLGEVVACVAESLGPEQRLTGQAPTVAWPDAPITVFGDDRLITVAVAAMVQALSACLDRRALGGASLRIASLRDGSTRGVEVSQTAMRLSTTVLDRLFDADWADHPGGPTGAILLAAARRIATLQGGTLDARPIETGGCRLVLTLPAAG